jgi:uncharacterized protein YeaO (DUF488 family)/alkylated DNA nucleotide flippase Atl1
MPTKTPKAPTKPASHRRIYAAVSRIPRGRVATYGQVAVVAGLPRRARLVGQALRALAADSDVPWHRVVNAKGRISARGDLLGHEDLQEQLLRREGVRFVGGAIPLGRHGWPAAANADANGGARRPRRSTTAAARAVRTKRVYDPPQASDGVRVLVDRLWPRGIKKAAARVDEWRKALAPSAPLRQWFGHDPGRWAEFQRRYRRELDAQPDAVAALRDLAAQRPVTLLYAAKDTEHNNAATLRDYLAQPD